MARLTRRISIHPIYKGITRVIIFGSGGLGREVLAVFRAMAAASQNVVCVGFAVDAKFAKTASVHGLPVHCGLTMLRDDPELRVIVALGDPAIRRRVVREIQDFVGVRFISALHPAASIGSEVQIGLGTMVLGPASITTDVSIGRHVLINPMVSIAHDCRLADFVTLAPGVALAGGVEVGEGAELGTGAQVIPRQTVGAWSMVGAGATVIRPVTANATVAGVPARPIAIRLPGWHDDS